MEPATETENVLVFLFNGSVFLFEITLLLVSFRPTALSRHHDKRTRIVSERTASPYRSWHNPTGNGVFNVFNFKTRTALSHVGIVGQSNPESLHKRSSSNCMSSTSSHIDAELTNSSHSKVLVSVKGGELQAAEYEELKAAQEAFEAEKKAWVKVRHEREEKEAALQQVNVYED